MQNLINTIYVNTKEENTMKFFDDDHIPTLDECLKEHMLQSRLEQIEEEINQRQVDVESLRNIEEDLRKNIVQLSGTLSQLYQLSGSLARIGITHDNTTSTI